MRKVVITSTNQSKIDAVKFGFGQMFPGEEFNYVAISVNADSIDFPLTDKETYNSALVRIEKASVEVPEADFWVGLQAGLEPKGHEVEAFAWVIIKSPRKMSKAKSATFYEPKEAAKLIVEGELIDEVDKKVFKEADRIPTDGVIGILTNNVITRTRLHGEAVIIALIPFINPDLY